MSLIPSASSRTGGLTHRLSWKVLRRSAGAGALLLLLLGVERFLAPDVSQVLYLPEGDLASISFDAPVARVDASDAEALLVSVDEERLLIKGIERGRPVRLYVRLADTQKSQYELRTLITAPDGLRELPDFTR